MHILFIFQKRAMEFWQRVGPVPAQILWRQILGEDQLEPVQNF